MVGRVASVIDSRCKADVSVFLVDAKRASEGKGTQRLRTRRLGRAMRKENSQLNLQVGCYWQDPGLYG